MEKVVVVVVGGVVVGGVVGVVEGEVDRCGGVGGGGQVGELDQQGMAVGVVIWRVGLGGVGWMGWMGWMGRMGRRLER